MTDKIWVGICPQCGQHIKIVELTLHSERYIPEDDLRIELDAARAEIRKLKKENEHLMTMIPPDRFFDGLRPLGKR